MVILSGAVNGRGCGGWPPGFPRARAARQGKEPEITCESGMVVYTCHSSTQEAESGRWRVLGQSRLHSKVLSQKEKSEKPV
jgi:hypothetical protein